MSPAEHRLEGLLGAEREDVLAEGKETFLQQQILKLRRI